MTDAEAYTVDIESMDTAVRAGESVDVTAAVENDGSEAGEATVTLAVDGADAGSESVELDAGETATVEFEWTADPDAVGTVELAVTGGADSATESVTVEDAPAEFTVGIESTDDHVSPGGTATVLAEVTNDGTVAGTGTVELRTEGEPQESRTLELDGQAVETVEFDHEVTEADAPEATLAVATEDDAAETSVPVVPETVTPLRKLTSKSGMGVFGWLMFLGMAILFIPLLPFLVVIKLLDMAFGGGEPTR